MVMVKVVEVEGGQAGARVTSSPLMLWWRRLDVEDEEESGEEEGQGGSPEVGLGATGAV
jgi:hypothetical protein